MLNSKRKNHIPLNQRTVYEEMKIDIYKDFSKTDNF